MDEGGRKECYWLRRHARTYHLPAALHLGVGRIQKIRPELWKELEEGVIQNYIVTCDTYKPCLISDFFVVDCKFYLLNSLIMPKNTPTCNLCCSFVQSAAHIPRGPVPPCPACVAFIPTCLGWQQPWAGGAWLALSWVTQGSSAGANLTLQTTSVMFHHCSWLTGHADEGKN